MARSYPAFLVSFAIILALLQACNRQKDNHHNNIANLPDREIRDLSYAIKGAASYREDFRKEVDSIRKILLSSSQLTSRFQTSLSLSIKYRPVNTDSALYYAHKAKALAIDLDSKASLEASIAEINALSTAGLFTEAQQLFSDLNSATMAQDTRLNYWLAGRRLYGYMKGYAQGNRECEAVYEQHYMEYDDSLLTHLPPHSDMRLFIECERLVTEKKYHEAQEKLQPLLNKLPQESNLYGMAAFQMAEVWKHLGDESQYTAYLALSALSDVKGCVTEGLALPTLADWLYQKGELGDAFTFINFALEEASSGNARMRAVSIARFVPIIDHAYRDKINSSRDELMIYFILVTILLIVTGILVVFMIKQIKKARANERKLSVTSRRQESYIGNFIGLYSSYADRLNRLTKLVSTKLATGQTADLKKLIDSGKFTDQDNDDIHKIFDAAFLDIYPDFVSQVNSLLKPEEKITVKSNEMLTPELRIYAFVKLGIEESTRIAQILHYSVNTVYTYRNKMRNKAINRDSFEQDIKNFI